MSEAAEDRAKAAKLPEGDVIRILLEQHASVHDLFATIESSAGAERKEAFDSLRALLAVHETAEEMVLRPVSRRTAGDSVAQSRNEEEDKASRVLADLEKMDVASAEFERTLGEFKSDVTKHAKQEENQEFPAILAQCDEAERQKMGKVLQTAEKTAPTHPHPVAAGSTTAQYALGPFASLMDRARDTIKSAAG